MAVPFLLALLLYFCALGACNRPKPFRIGRPLSQLATTLAGDQGPHKANATSDDHRPSLLSVFASGSGQTLAAASLLGLSAGLSTASEDGERLQARLAELASRAPEAKLQAATWLARQPNSFLGARAKASQRRGAPKPKKKAAGKKAGEKDDDEKSTWCQMTMDSGSCRLDFFYGNACENVGASAGKAGKEGHWCAAVSEVQTRSIKGLSCLCEWYGRPEGDLKKGGEASVTLKRDDGTQYQRSSLLMQGLDRVKSEKNRAFFYCEYSLCHKSDVACQVHGLLETCETHAAKPLEEDSACPASQVPHCQYLDKFGAIIVKPIKK